MSVEEQALLRKPQHKVLPASPLVLRPRCDGGSSWDLEAIRKHQLQNICLRFGSNAELWKPQHYALLGSFRCGRERSSLPSAARSPVDSTGANEQKYFAKQRKSILPTSTDVISGNRKVTFSRPGLFATLTDPGHGVLRLCTAGIQQKMLFSPRQAPCAACPRGVLVLGF